MTKVLYHNKKNIKLGFFIINLFYKELLSVYIIYQLCILFFTLNTSRGHPNFINQF